MLVLRRLADAQADGLPIYAVIEGGAVNSDGRSNGLTAPNRWAQQQVVADGLRAGGSAAGARSASSRRTAPGPCSAT